MRAVDSLLLAGSLLLLAGCPQPPDTPTDAPSGPGAAPPPSTPPGEGSGTPPAPAGEPPGAPDGQAPAGGAPPAAPPADDAAGTPGGDGCEWAGVDGQWSAYEGKEMVRFSGEIAYDGDAKGHVLVDFLDAERDILLSARCQEAGRLEVQVPKDLGAVTVVALIDADFNGPTRNDAVGRVADVVEIKGEDIDGLSISLVDGGDLGDITLPEPSGREAHPPVEGEVPPEEAKDMGNDEGEPPAEPGAPPNPYKQGG